MPTVNSVSRQDRQPRGQRRQQRQDKSASAVTRFDGTAVFSVTDAKAEQATFTANDTSDGLALTPTLTPTVFFVTPPATSASIEAAPTSVNNDGKSTAAITVTLKDSLGRADRRANWSIFRRPATP